MNQNDLWAAAECSLDGMFIGAPDGRIFYANPAACALLQASEEEIIRKGRQGLTPADDPRWEAAVEQRARAGHAHLVGPVIRPNGSRFLADVTSSLFTGSDGEHRHIVIMRDITRRVRLEQRSAGLHEITRALLGGTNTGEVLSMIAGHSRSLLDASDAAIFIPSPTQPGYVGIAAVDGPAVSELLGRHYPAGSLAGRVLAERRSQLVEDLSAEATTEDGRAVGLGPGVVVPIVAGERAFGVIMVGALPGSRAYDIGDLEDVQMFADAAAVALDIGEARAELESLQLERAEQLQRALESRVIIEQAKGFIAATRGMSSEEAFDRLRRYARGHNANIHNIATRVMSRTLIL